MATTIPAWMHASERLLRLMRTVPGRSRFYLLAFDKHYERDGSVNVAHTEFYVPNRYVFSLTRDHPELLQPVASVHPYRHDAIAALDRAAARGARLVKWLPNAMGIDPADARLDPQRGRATRAERDLRLQPTAVRPRAQANRPATWQ